MEKRNARRSGMLLGIRDFIYDKELIIVGTLLCVIFWLLQSFLHIYVFKEGMTFKEGLLYPGPHELWVRLSTVILVMVLVVYSQLVVNKMRKVQKKISESEKSIDESEKKYRAIFKQSANAIALIDAKTGKIVEFNDKACSFLGYTKEEFASLSLADIESQENPEEIKEHVEKIAYEGSDSFETKHRAKTGEIHDGLVNASLIEVKGEKYVLSIWSDITEQKKTEAMLKVERDKAQRYLDMAGVMIVALNSDGTVSLVNRKGCEILGYDEDEILGKDWFENFLPENTRDRTRQLFDDVMSGNAENVEGIEGVVVAKDGSEKTISWHNVPISDEEDRITGTISSGEDITEQKRLQDEIIKKNRELESFVYTVSHDLKSPLVTFNGFIEYLTIENKDKFDEKSRHIVERLLANVRYMNDLIRDLLEFSRVGRTNAGKETIKTEDLFNETKEKFADRCKDKGIEFSLDVGCECVIYGERSQLYQIMDNLVDNAIKFIGESEGKKIELICAKSSGGYTRFCVKDNGIGIDPKYHDKVFEIFQRLEPAGADAEGTGIGLTLIKKIVDQHEGKIWVVSEEGNGAEFWVELPARKGDDDDEK